MRENNKWGSIIKDDNFMITCHTSDYQSKKFSKIKVRLIIEVLRSKILKQKLLCDVLIQFYREIRLYFININIQPLSDNTNLTHFYFGIFLSRVIRLVSYIINGKRCGVFLKIWSLPILLRDIFGISCRLYLSDNRQRCIVNLVYLLFI